MRLCGVLLFARVANFGKKAVISHLCAGTLLFKKPVVDLLAVLRLGYYFYG